MSLCIGVIPIDADSPAPRDRNPGDDAVRAARLLARGVAAALAAAIFVACLLFPSLAGAQAREVTLPADATLTKLIAESLSARPELARSLAIVRAQEQRIPQASALPDPMLQIGIQNDGFTSIEIGRMGTSYVSFMLSQTFPWPGKLSLQGEVAELDATEAKEGVTRVRLSTEADVRRAYLGVLLARDRLALLDRLDAVGQKALAFARLRYEINDGAQSDVLRAQLGLSRLKLRRLALHAEELTLVEDINRVRAHPLDEAIETPTHLKDLPAPATLAATFSVDRALARSPELAAARLRIPRADRSIALAEKSYYPDLTVGAAIMVRGALPPMWALTLGGPLPLFAGSKQSRAVAENRALRSAAEHEVAAIEQALRLRTAERRATFSALLETIDLYEQGLLVESETTTDSTLSQYKVGKVPFSSVLEANAGFIADQEAYLQAIAAAHRLLVDEAEGAATPAPAMPAGAAAPDDAMASK